MLCENMQCVCVYVQRENFASLDELKEGSVFCAREREQTAIVIPRPLFSCL